MLKFRCLCLLTHFASLYVCLCAVAITLIMTVLAGTAIFNGKNQTLFQSIGKGVLTSLAMVPMGMILNKLMEVGRTDRLDTWYKETKRKHLAKIRAESEVRLVAAVMMLG